MGVILAFTTLAIVQIPTSLRNSGYSTIQR
jgi:hypothetical protein